MNRMTWLRTPVLFLLFALWAVPAVAAERPVRTEQDLIANLWQMLTELVPDLTDLGPGLDPLGETVTSDGDLGPGLDPLG